MYLSEMPLHRTPPVGLSDADFFAWCDDEDERLGQLFVESQIIAKANPHWFAEIDEPIKNQIERIRDGNDWPVTSRGQTLRVERLPEPEIADAFVRLVAECIDKNKEFDLMQENAVLTSHALMAAAARKSMSFTDFDRNARTNEPNATNPDNVRAFLRMHRLELRWNAWWQRQEIGGHRSGAANASGFAPLTDARIAQLMTQAGDTQHCFRPSEVLFRRTLETVAREAVYDPIVEYLASVESQWDGVPRLLTWLSRAVGVPCDLYHQAVAKNVIGGMVKRARDPGAKHDEVMILIGEQGTYKSTLCRALAWKPEFFTDSVAFDGSPQNVVPQLFGKWIIELGELDGMASRETSFLKRFISAQSDNVTLKYKALATDYARRCVFIGTSNDDRVLRDATGNRRFLPVRVDRQIDVDWVRDNIDQLFGEAAAMHTAGANFAIPANVVPEARAHQEAARVEADFESHLEAWFGGDREPLQVLPAEIATLLKDATGRSVTSNKYGPTMRRLGFVDGTPRINGKPTRAWTRGGGAVRVMLHRDGNGRLLPRVNRMSVVPLPAIPSRNS